MVSYLRITNVFKSFGPFRALDGVNVSVEKGHIHAILGENGAGKTSLMNVIYGLYGPDAGEIAIEDRPVSFNSPADAIACGIGMIHQHFQLANALSVVENIVLGLPGGARLDLAGHARRISEMSKSYGFDIDPWAQVWKLPIGMRQRVEILKALYRKASILVLDEPTSVLAPREIESFLSGLRRMRDMGHTILFITHKLEEVMATADRVSIMRKGRVVADVDAAQTSASEISSIMVGRDFAPTTRTDTIKGSTKVLELKAVSALNDRLAPALHGVSLTLASGEILGISGVDGNGQAELAQVITGLRAVSDGDIELDGRTVLGLSIRELIVKAGISYVPEDRHTTGLVLDYPVGRNLILRDFDRPPVSRAGLIDHKAVEARARDMIERYDIRTPGINQPVRLMSGGNQQKVILARELSSRPRVLIIAQATKGLDVGAIAFVQNKILEEKARGAAILYISTELEHLLEVSDRVGILCAGRLSPIVRAEDATSERIGQYMAGLFQEVA
jgi:general nucleoside transport system ATP-binding protein